MEVNGSPGVFGVWTPVLTFVTPGDLAVVYSAQTGTWFKNGREVTISFFLITTTFTFTTASGNLRITGALWSPESSVDYLGAVGMTGITKALYTNFAANPVGGQTYIEIKASGSGQTLSVVTAADAPTAVQKRLEGTATFLTL